MLDYNSGKTGQTCEGDTEHTGAYCLLRFDIFLMQKSFLAGPNRM